MVCQKYGRAAASDYSINHKCMLEFRISLDRLSFGRNIEMLLKVELVSKILLASSAIEDSCRTENNWPKWAKSIPPVD